MFEPGETVTGEPGMTSGVHSPVKSGKGITCIGILCIGLLVLILLPLVMLIVLRGVGAYLVTADPLVKADAVVALSGAGDYTRLEEAARLYKEKYVKWFIITETGEFVPGTQLTYSSFIKKQVEDMGIPEKSILITDKKASSTWGEARVVGKLLLAKGFKSCIVVTDPFHTRRTKIVFQDVFKSWDLSVRVRPVPNHGYRSKDWWTTSEGLNNTINEIIKLFGYIFLDLKQN